MNEMTLSSKHRIRNSSPGGLRPSSLPLSHRGSPQYCVSHVDLEETFCFFQTTETGNRTSNSGVKGSGANHYPRAPARLELQKFYKFCAAHSPVRLDIETKFLYFLFLTWLSKIRNQKFRQHLHKFKWRQSKHII